MPIQTAFQSIQFIKNRQKVHYGIDSEVEYFQFQELLRHDCLAHAVFTRHGGVSEPPYDTLNTGYSTGDSYESVRKNLKTIKKVIGAEQLYFLHQVHGKEALILRRDNRLAVNGPVRADAIITDIPQVAIMIKQADCQAVILFDPERRVISNVHCGWRGNTRNILGSVAGIMISDFGCNASNLIAAIGPSLGPCCGEFVGHEKIFPKEFRSFMVRDNHFDLWEVSRRQLQDAGIKKENIQVARLCTRCRTDLFYSFRAEGVTGRFATVAMLK